MYIISESRDYKGDREGIPHTPNCNNVVIEKSKKQKAKSQIGIN